MIAAAADDGCRPVSIGVTGAGSLAAPFALSANLDLTRLVRLDGNEPWAIGTDGSCQILVPRCSHQMVPFMRMADSGGALVGYSWLELDCETGLADQVYQALGTSVTTSTRPAGWEPYCSTEATSEVYPFFTTADDPSTIVGYLWLDSVGGIVTQQYVTLAGAVTHAKPSGWLAGACGSTTGGGGVGGGPAPTEIGDSTELQLFSSMVQVGYFPDYGIPDLATARRKHKLLLPPGYDGADWTRLTVTLENVSAPLASDFVIALLDLTNSVTVATITIPAGTSPTANEIFRSLTIGAGSFLDNTNIQWQISSVENGNSFACRAVAFYNLIVETAS